jgi:hypothetical protein
MAMPTEATAHRAVTQHRRMLPAPPKPRRQPSAGHSCTVGRPRSASDHPIERDSEHRSALSEIG